MPAIKSKEDLTPEQQACLAKVCERFAASNRLHRQFEDRWNTWYGLSRNWRRGGKALQQANTPNDKDIVLDELKRQWGQELFIPYCFTVIETNVPRILSQPPRYRALPVELGENEEAACVAMAKLYERDASAMRYERKLQETVRSGLRYGLGVQKSYWEKKTRSGKKITKKLYEEGSSAYDTEVVVFEGPQVESVDIFDFFWDPAAFDLDSAGYVIHRTWRPFSYIVEKVNEGKRNREQGLDKGWLELDLEAVKKLATSKARGEAWAGRMEAAGLSNYDTQGGELYEVWECHDREQVITTLGGAGGILVQEDENPFIHGDFPFEIYRPTLVEHEFCGIGEVEPIAHLQWELNTMRGQRRDAATLALNRGYWYKRGSLNPKDVVIGAGVFNPVLGDPNNVIVPMPFQDIPQSGVEEEQAIKADIELTTALSESVVGSGGEETATGTQLVQQAAGLRIKQKAKNLHVDLLVPETKKRKALYEQFVVAHGQSQSIRVASGVSDETPTGYAYITVTPDMFSANIEVDPVDGSTEADDPAQKKHDAGELGMLLAPFAPFVNVPAFIKYAVGQHDIEDPEDWVKQGPSPAEAASQSVQSVIKEVADAMQQAGIAQPEIEQILQAAHAGLESSQPEEPEAPESQGQSPAPTEPEPPAPAQQQAPEPIGAQ